MGDVKKSLTNCLTAEHCFVIGEWMTQFQDLKQRIENGEREFLIDSLQIFMTYPRDRLSLSNSNTMKKSPKKIFGALNNKVL
jgi:hypothetical protein